MTRMGDAQMADEAAAWVARMDGDEWTAASEAELQKWLAGDERRRGALLRAQAAWMTLDRLSQVPATDGRLLGRRNVLIAGGGALAASLVGGLVWFNSGLTYSTSIGEIRRVPLPDGSTVAINTGSELNFKLGAKRREVRLTSGEAWFQVAKDVRRPFVVEAGSVLVQAVGTAFSVRRKKNGAEILVTEGVVEAWVEAAVGARVRLRAGDRAFVSDDAGVRREQNSTSIDRTLAWRDGTIALDGDTLESAVAEFNRYNSRKLVLADQRLAGERLDGSFRTDDPEGFANAVHSSLDVPVTHAVSGEIWIGRRSE